MRNSNQNLIKLLQQELVFLETGGYEASPRTPWKVPLVFEDSPSCPNMNDVTQSRSCSECQLIQLVPIRHRVTAVPCRHIPFNTVGETLETLYRWGTLDDLRLIFRHWLIRTITELRAKEARLQWLRKQNVY